MDILNNIINEESAITGTEFSTIGSIFSVVLNTLLGIGISISVIAIILSGIKMVTSQGDPKSFDSGKKSFTYSVISLILTMGALVIKAIVFNLAGADEANITSSIPNF